MKKLIFLVAIVAMFIGITSCSHSKKEEQPQKWEYKVISEWGTAFSVYYAKTIPVPQDKLNQLGDEGWELVDVYTRIQTVHPNFGNERYVTGLQPNTRTEAVYYVFKRPKVQTASDDSAKETKSTVAVEDTLIADTTAVAM